MAPPPARRPPGVTGAGASTPAAVRGAGVVGAAAGVVLLAAYVIPIEGAANTLRLLLFVAGLAAIAGALWMIHAPLDRPLATAGSLPVIAAAGAFAAWLLAAQAVARPFAGDFGLLGFWISIVMWLAAAWLGIVAVRLGRTPRVASWLLVLGPLLTITGFDRLELRARLGVALVDAVSLAGIAMLGVSLVLLGWFLVRRED